MEVIVMYKLHNEPCKICGSSNNYYMESEGRKSLFCDDCNHFEDIYVSEEIQQYWKDQEAAEKQAKMQANIQSNKNVPKCPTCQSSDLKKISMTSKAVNTMMFGFLGTKRNKTFHCNNCGYEW